MQVQDMIGGLLDLCIVTCSQVSQSVVGSIADVVQSIAPPGASRDKVRSPIALSASKPRVGHFAIACRQQDNFTSVF